MQKPPNHSYRSSYLWVKSPIHHPKLQTPAMDGEALLALREEETGEKKTEALIVHYP